jgi:NAD(P)-dependent dehydrogenase (short-subunit alcohol dehydrogenase family)
MGNAQMDKHLIITGASKGIGLATAKLFLGKGFKVINLSRTPSCLQEVVNIQVDLANLVAQEDLAQKLYARLYQSQQITLIHNAAKLVNDSVKTAKTEILREVLEVNVIAPSILNQIILPKMPTGSAIIYVGATLSEKAVADLFSYITSKHATVGMMRATCQDLMGTGIHTACVCPGFTDTEMLRARINDDASVVKQLASMVSKNRLIEPAEIAETLYFVATNSVLNGSVIHANLGQKER